MKKHQSSLNIAQNQLQTVGEPNKGASPWSKSLGRRWKKLHQAYLLSLCSGKKEVERCNVRKIYSKVYGK